MTCVHWQIFSRIIEFLSLSWQHKEHALNNTFSELNNSVAQVWLSVGRLSFFSNSLHNRADLYKK